jgi:hypothetical protein
LFLSAFSQGSFCAASGNSASTIGELAKQQFSCCHPLKNVAFG